MKNTKLAGCSACNEYQINKVSFLCPKHIKEYYDNHDCKLSRDSGCRGCDEYFSLEENDPAPYFQNNWGDIQLEQQAESNSWKSEGQ